MQRDQETFERVKRSLHLLVWIKAGQVRSRSFIGQRTIYYGLSLISLQWTDMIETDNCIEIQNSVCPKSPTGVHRDQAKVSQ